MKDENKRAELAVKIVEVWANLQADTAQHNAKVQGNKIVPLNAPFLDPMELLKQYRSAARWLRDNPI